MGNLFLPDRLVVQIPVIKFGESMVTLWLTVKGGRLFL